MSRAFEPQNHRKYGRPTLPPHALVIDSPRYDFSKLKYFQYLPNRSRPLWVSKRSLVISIDGASRGNHDKAIASKASYGVYFGCASPYNTCGRLDNSLDQTSSRAEIEAAIQAVEVIVRMDLTDQKTTMVVIKTDSEYLHNSMTEWMRNWLRSGGKGSKGTEVAHWPSLLKLHERIGEVERAQKLRILFWWVKREYNHGADQLANDALDGADSAYSSN